MPNLNGMFNSTVLDVGIGLIFIYLLLAIICTALNEWISGGFRLRSKNLASAIEQLLDNQKGSGDSPLSFLDQFYSHPLVSSQLTPGAARGNNHPAYLPSRIFATAVMDLATVQKRGTIAFSDLDQGIKNLPNGDVKTALLALIQNADSNLQKAQRNIEQWFDDTMDRASGWYKRRNELVTIAVAIFLTLLTNADTVKITRTLWKSPTERAALVEKASSRTAASQPSVSYPDKNAPLKPQLTLQKDDVKDLTSLLGWSAEDAKLSGWGAWLQRIIGWILTIAAVTLGAPFWFDLLSKLVNVRNAGKKPKTSDEQESDKQDKSDKPTAPQPA